MYYILPHWLLGLVTGSWSKPALIYLYQNYHSLLHSKIAKVCKQSKVIAHPLAL